MKWSVGLSIWSFRALVALAGAAVLLIRCSGHQSEAFFRGLGVTLLLSLFVSPVVSWARSGWPLEPPPHGLEFMREGFGRPGPLMIGVLEAATLFVAFSQEAWALAGGWLVFKAASKWASWQHVMKIPESLQPPGEPLDVEYLRFRWAWSSDQLVAFLFGTRANIAVAIAGFVVAEGVR